MNPEFVRAVRVARLAFVALVAAQAACGDGGTDPSKPSAMVAVSPDSQTTAAGVKMSQPLVVRVTGGGGTPIAGTVVDWTIGTGGGTVSDSVSTTSADGEAQTTYTPGTAPAIAGVTAAAGSLRKTFRIVLVAGPPAQLRKFGFDSPAAITGSVLTLSVKLVDAFGNGVSGKSVSWANAGGSISATTSTTDNGGIASVTYTLGADPGTYSLTATAEGVDQQTFNIKAI
jgi:adhesin/invasin